MTFLLLCLSFVLATPLLGCQHTPTRALNTRLESLEDFTINELVDLEHGVKKIKYKQQDSQLNNDLKQMRMSAEIAVLKEAAAERELVRIHELARINREISGVKTLLQEQEKRHNAELQHIKEDSNNRAYYLKWGLTGLSSGLAVVSAAKMYAWYKNEETLQWKPLPSASSSTPVQPSSPLMPSIGMVKIGKEDHLEITFPGGGTVRVRAWWQ